MAIKYIISESATQKTIEEKSESKPQQTHIIRQPYLLQLTQNKMERSLQIYWNMRMKLKQHIAP